jgi:PAS domain S-box-containing protein
MSKLGRMREFENADILVVDDQPENLKLLASLLQRLGASVRVAKDGEQAILAVREHLPALILLDIMMPVMDGYETARALKKNSRTAEIPIIFISAMTELDERIQAFNVGGVDYITKPFQLQEVIARCRTHLRIYQQQREIQHLYERDKERLQQLEHEMQQRAIAEAERYKLWMAVEQSANSIVITDAEGTIEYVNPKFVTVTGYQRSEAIGAKPSILKSGYTNDDEYAEMWKTISNGHVWHGAFHNKRKNGELYWELASISPITDDDGNIVSYIAVKEDITARRETENALYEAMQRISLMNRIISATSTIKSPSHVLDVTAEEVTGAFNADHALIITVDHEHAQCHLSVQYPFGSQPDVRRHNINLGDCALYARLLDLPVPYVTHDIIHDPHLNVLAGCLEQLKSKSMLAIPMFTQEQLLSMIVLSWHEEHDFSTNDIALAGEIGQASSQAYENALLHNKLKIQNEMLEGIVDERTEQLHRLNQRMAAILGSINDGIVLLHDDGTISMTNGGFDTMLNSYPDAHFGQSITKLTDEAHISIIQHAFTQIQRGEKPAPLYINVCRDDGNMLDVALTLSPVGDDEGHIVATYHDISELKEAERMKDNFVSMVTHELRTPITSMMLISNSLNKYYERMDDDKRQAKLKQLNEQVTVMGDLVESVLDISRLEMRTHQPSHNSISLVIGANQILEELQPNAQAKQQALSMVHDDGAIVSGDSVDFARIWRNLISNAIKYTDEEGQIMVLCGTLNASGGVYQWSPALTRPREFDATLADGTYAIGQVRDNGHGIRPEDLPHMFTRFYRGWAKQSNIIGSGLGLSLVRDLLELYGGGIHVDSILNEGTLFTFWVPRLQERTQKNQEEIS